MSVKQMQLNPSQTSGIGVNYMNGGFIFTMFFSFVKIKQLTTLVAHTSKIYMSSLSFFKPNGCAKFIQRY
jgi:hypothetical protein